MLNECLQVFKKLLEEQGEDLILRDYIPADGTYVLVNKDYKIKSTVEIKLDKKTGEIDRSAVYYNDICYYDYYSKLISMNKPQDPMKIIHSNNFYSFWVKKENIANGKLTNEIIDKYYKILEEPILKYEKGKSAELYQVVIERLGDVDKFILQKNKAWIKENIFSIDKLINVDLEKKDYLKIFFEAEYPEYEKEGKRYFIPNIYNSNNYNIKVKGKVLGLPDNNQGMNSKKTFLSVKTRKVAMPYLLDENEVMIQKQLFDYLMNFVNTGKYNVYVDLERNEFTACRNDEFPIGSICGFFLRLQKGKNEAEIHYQDVIPFYNNNLEKEMKYVNFIHNHIGKHPEYEMEYHSYNKLSDLEKLVDNIFFSKMLRNNYFTESEKLSITDERLKRNLLMHRLELFSWFHIKNEVNIVSVIDKVSMEAIKASIIYDNLWRAERQINLRLSLIEYIGKGEKDMADFSVNMRENLKKKIISDVSTGLDSDAEYYYAVGQLTRYYLYLNKSSKKNESLVNPILNAKNNETIKYKLLQYYKKYNYCISLGSKKADTLYKMILGYETEEKVKQDMICMGFVDNNIVLEKKEDSINE